jgi:Uma2 family endonuclease
MYDLPSEFPEEPGLPDEFHALQPHLLSHSLSLVNYSRNEWFTGTNLNLYYDPQHPLWHKRPDWFLALDVPCLYGGRELRRSYVTWQEGRSPHMVIEFLSPGTEEQNLGRFYRLDETNGGAASSTTIPAPDGENTPHKLTVYERYLRVPHYLIFDRRQRSLRYFQLVGTTYQEQAVADQTPMVWFEDLQVGLGIWEGEFDGILSHWLRWCDAAGQWLPTDTEREQQAREQERLAKEQAQQRADRMAQRLRELGINPEEI